MISNLLKSTEGQTLSVGMDYGSVEVMLVQDAAETFCFRGTLATYGIKVRRRCASLARTGPVA